MNRYKSHIWILLLLTFGCNSKPYKEQESKRILSSIIEKDSVKGEMEDVPSDTVVIIERTLITDSTDQEFYKSCLAWELTEADIKRVLALSDTISEHEFHYLYYYLPCEIHGNLRLKDKEFNFILNSGSFIQLIGSDTSFYLGCASQNCEKYFLEKGGEFGEKFE